MPLALLVVVPGQVDHVLPTLVGHSEALQVFVSRVAHKHAHLHNLPVPINSAFFKLVALRILGLEKWSFHAVCEFH